MNDPNQVAVDSAAAAAAVGAQPETQTDAPAADLQQQEQQQQEQTEPASTEDAQTEAPAADQEKTAEPTSADLDAYEQQQAQRDQAKAATEAAKAAANEPSENLKKVLDEPLDEPAAAGTYQPKITERGGMITGTAGAIAGGAPPADPQKHVDAMVNRLVSRFPRPQDFVNFVLELEDRMHQVESRLLHHGINGPAILNEVGEAVGEALDQR